MTELTATRGARRLRTDWFGAPVEPSKATIVAFGVGALLVLGIGAALGPKPGVAALGAMAFGLVVLRRPIVGAYVLCALAPALSGLQRGLPIPGFRISELMIVGIAVVVLVAARTTPRWGAFDWIAFGYVVANAGLVWVNVVRQGDTFDSEIQGTMFGPLQFFLLYRTLITAVRDEVQRARALRLLLLASVPVSILTLMQQWNVGPARSLVETLAGAGAAEAYRTTVDDVARATGPFPHWHNLAGYLLLMLLLGVSLLHERDQTVMRRSRLILTLVPAFVALGQTASIAPLTGLVIGAVLIATYVGQTRRVLVGIGVTAMLATVVFWPVFAQRLGQQYDTGATTEGQTFLPQTIAFRVEVWTTQFFPVIRDNFLIGYGPSLPPRLFFGYAESLYVTFLLRGGIVLLLFYLLLMGSLAFRAHRVAQAAEPGRRAAARALFAAVLLLLAIDTIATYFVDSGPAPLLWALAGLIGYDWAANRPVGVPAEPPPSADAASDRVAEPRGQPP